MFDCPKCRCPQLGNETFCSNCGTRVFQGARGPGTRRSLGSLLIAVLALLLLLGVFGLASVRFARGRARIPRKSSFPAIPSRQFPSAIGPAGFDNNFDL